MKKLSSFILVVLFLLTATKSSAYTTADWMADLADNVKLSDVSMIGTHDAGTSIFSGLFQCQNRPIAQQLEDGVRFLDIRLKTVNKVLKVAHGDATSNNEWTTEVLTPIKNFLAAHPTETVMMMVKSEPGNTEDDITAKMNDYLNDPAYSSMFYTVPSINPCLGNVRGKCILVRRYETDGQPHNTLGLNVQQGWPVSNSTPSGAGNYLGYGIRQTTQPPYFRVEDLYYYPGWPNKQAAITDNLTAAKTSSIFCLTYTSFAPISKSEAQTANEWILSQMQAESGYRKWGIIAVDYYNNTPALMSAVIQSNLANEPANVYVNSNGGDDTNSGADWNNAFATLTQAYNAVGEAGTIHVKGNYNLSSPLTLAKKCTVRGYGNPVLSGGGTSRVIDVTAGTVNLYGLTISDGYEGNGRDSYSGGLYITGGTVSIYNCIITNNTTGQQYGAGGITVNGSNAECYVYNSVIANNVNTYSNSGRVCGIRPESGSVYVYNTIFWNNHMPQGAINHINNTGNVKAFYNNIADMDFWTSADKIVNKANNILETDKTVIFADYDDNKLYPSAPLSAFAGHNLGTNSGVYSTDVDIAGNQRITETTVDIGAYEGIAKPNIVAGNNVSSINVPAMDDFYSYGAVVTAPMTLSATDMRPVALEGVNYTKTGANTWDAAIAITNSATITLSADNPIWFVKTTGNDANAGHSWNEAKQTIEAALSAASAGDMVFIEGGTYTVPANGFYIDKAISLYGGFAGVETSPDARAKVSNGKSYEFANPTIISGDGITYTGENRHRIFTINYVSATTDILLDGLTLTQSTTDDRAPAIYGRGALTLRDCIFSDNVAPAAGSQTVGGAVAYEYTGGTLTVEGCKFENNSCGQYGGGICLKDGTVNISNSEFIGNSSRNGGGVYIYPNMTATISNSVFQGNQTFYEGAAIMNNGGMLTSTQCLFIANKTATRKEGYGHGEAIYSRNNGAANVYNCLFVDNTSTATHSDCQSINGNGSTAFNVYNSIFYGNKNGDAIGVNIFNNNICTTIPEATTASGNIVQTNTDALFTNYAANDYTPTINSYAINRGASVGNEPTTDFAGNQRVVGLAIDMGPYEYQTVTYPVTVTTSNVTIPNPLPINAVTIPADLKFQYDTDLFHAPRALVNGISSSITTSDSENTVSLPNQLAPLNIMIAAFPLNVIPVSEDTYVRGGSDNENTNWATAKEIQVEYSTYQSPKYMKRAYLDFSIPQSILDAHYRNIILKLIYKGKEKKQANTVAVYLPPTSITANLNEMTWAGNAETAALNGTLLSSEVNIPNGQSADTEYKFDISGMTLQHSIRLQVTSPANTPGDGWVAFHSLENGNPDFIPMLVFSQPSFKVQPNETKNVSDYNAGINGDNYGDIIIYSDNNSTGQLIEASDFTPNGVVKFIKTFNVDEWYPIGFPFEVSKINAPAALTSNDLEIYDETIKDGDFWLKKYEDRDAYSFEYSKVIDKNIGYAIQFPDDFNGYEVRFTSANNPKLNAIDEDDLETALSSVLTSTTPAYYLVANPSSANLMLKEANKYYIAHKNGANIHYKLMTSGEATVKPFESFGIAYNFPQGARLRASLDTNEATSINFSDFENPTCSPRYFNLQGIEVANPIKGNVYIEKRANVAKKVLIK